MLGWNQVPVAHVVFMIHGIGQRMDTAHLVDDVTIFRRNCAVLAEQHLSRRQRQQQRCLFIPCQVGPWMHATQVSDALLTLRRERQSSFSNQFPQPYLMAVCCNEIRHWWVTSWTTGAQSRAIVQVTSARIWRALILCCIWL